MCVGVGDPPVGYAATRRWIVLIQISGVILNRSRQCSRLRAKPLIIFIGHYVNFELIDSSLEFNRCDRCVCVCFVANQSSSFDDALLVTWSDVCHVQCAFIDNVGYNWRVWRSFRSGMKRVREHVAPPSTCRFTILTRSILLLRNQFIAIWPESLCNGIRMRRNRRWNLLHNRFRFLQIVMFSTQSDFNETLCLISNPEMRKWIEHETKSDHWRERMNVWIEHIFGPALARAVHLCELIDFPFAVLWVKAAGPLWIICGLTSSDLPFDLRLTSHKLIVIVIIILLLQWLYYYYYWKMNNMSEDVCIRVYELHKKRHSVCSSMRTSTFRIFFLSARTYWNRCLLLAHIKNNRHENRLFSLYRNYLLRCVPIKTGRFVEPVYIRRMMVVQWQ